MVGVPITDKAAARAPRRKKLIARADAARIQSQSLLDVIDNVIDKGLAVDAEIVLGLADIDLIYLRVGALLAAADRVFGQPPKPRRKVAAPSRLPSSAPELSPGVAPGRTRADSTIVARDLGSVSSASPATRAPDDTSRSVIRLVLTLVEFVRQLLERQAVRRVKERTLNAEEIERLGTALMRLEATVHELADRHGIDASDLNLDLGPLGTLR